MGVECSMDETFPKCKVKNAPAGIQASICYGSPGMLPNSGVQHCSNTPDLHALQGHCLLLCVHYSVAALAHCG